MLKLDEINKGIAFTDTFKDFPDYFTAENQEKINLALVKLNSVLVKYDSAAEAISSEFFSDEEIDAYALWRAAVYYSNHPPLTTDLKRKIFVAVLERFTRHYRALAGRES